MLVCIDENGCTGFKLDRGSKPYFIIAMVIFKELHEAEQCSKAIQDLKTQLRIKTEFKFRKSHANVKEAFFLCVKKYQFTVRAIVVDKRNIYSKYLRDSKSHFYNYFVHLLMKNDNNILQGANVKIDGSGDRPFRQELNRYLRQQLGAGVIKKFRFVDSKKDNLIQLADMVAGAIAKSYQNHKEGDRWTQLLDKRIENIWEFNQKQKQEDVAHAT